MVVNFSSIVRYYSSNTNRSFYVTTPIFYVNAAPHIGHLYSAVIADAVYRYQKIKNPNRLYKFSTGTDEHGIKIQQAAAIHKIPTNEYCEKISKEYENIFKLAGIQYTDFIRTSDERHKNTVKQFWNKLKTNDCIYSSTYSGWYCVSDETFLTDNQLKLNSNGKKVSAESGHPVEWTDEQNYLFKLSKYQSDIIEWIKEGNHIKPKKFEKILLDYLLNEPLNDLSISRPTTRVKWGIKVPDDDTQTIYVWLDALVNYLTCSNLYLSSDTDSKDRKFWPPTLQIIGKDILKFHGIYWPAFLIAAGLELPECLLVHSHWTVDGEKMSKSKFNVIDPIDRSSLYTMEGLRYFLLREGVAHSDGNYSDTKILRILNSELADTLGNLLSRCCAKTLNPRQIYPKIHIKQFKDIIEMDVTKNLMESLNQLPEKCEKHYDDCNFYMVVDQVMKTLHIANNFFETTKPWELIKNYKKQIIAKKINVKEVPLINNENRIDKFSTDAAGGIKDKKSASVDIETAVATSTSLSATATLAISTTKTATPTSTMATATVIEQDDEFADNIHQLETIICIVMDTLRICAIILQPIIPDICQKLLDKLNVPHTERYWEKLKFSQQQPQQQKMLENITSDILSNNCNAYIKYLCCNRIENERNLGATDSVLFRRIIMEENKSLRIEKTNDKKPKTKRK